MFVSTANPKQKQLHHRDKQREEKRAGVANDVQEFLPADGHETAKEGRHRCDSLVCNSMMR